MIVTYNTATIPFARTLQATSGPVPTSEGGGDVLHIQHDFAWEGVLTPDVPGLVRPGETFAAAVNRVRRLLQQPRKKLEIRMDGAYLTADADTDVKNGPLPEPFQVMNVTGEQACTIRWGVKFHTPVCEDRSRHPQWVAHRWKERLTIDPNTFAKTWTRTGVLHVRPGEWNADAFRGVVTPAIREGYKRVKPPEYELAEDGLSLRYTFSDEEQYAMPPAGAITIEGHCDLSANMSMYQYAEVLVRLTGSITADKYRLLQTATVVANQKLEDMGAGRNAKGLVLPQGALRTSLARNEVEVYFRARIAPQKDPIEAANGAGRSIGALLAPLLFGFLLEFFKTGEKKPGDDPTPDFTPVPKTFDPARGLTRKPAGFDSDPPDPACGGEGLSLLAAALQDPCLAPTATPYVGGKGHVIEDPNGTGSSSDRLRTDPAQEPIYNGGSVGTTNSRAATDAVSVVGGVQSFAQVPRLNVPPTPMGFSWPKPIITTIPRASFDATDLLDAAKPTLSALYTDYSLKLRVQRKSGKTGRTEQRAGGLTQFVQVSAPSMTILLEYTGKRAGGKAAVPDVSKWGDNYVVLEEENDAEGEIEVAEDGVTLINTRNGSVLIGVKDPSKATLYATIAPWVSELLGRLPVPLAGPEGPPADPESFRQWRDQYGELRSG